MPRAVLDANVLISGFITPRGTPGRRLSEFHTRAFELVTSPVLLAEVGDVLGREKLRRYVDEREAAAFVALLHTESTVLADPPAGLEPIGAGPRDEYLFRLARAAYAVLVSGDAHVLALGDRLPVISPAAFLRELAG